MAATATVAAATVTATATASGRSVPVEGGAAPRVRAVHCCRRCADAGWERYRVARARALEVHVDEATSVSHPAVAALQPRHPDRLVPARLRRVVGPVVLEARDRHASAVVESVGDVRCALAIAVVRIVRDSHGDRGRRRRWRGRDADNLHRATRRPSAHARVGRADATRRADRDGGMQVRAVEIGVHIARHRDVRARGAAAARD
eukprot:624468-Prymnesium_polylepis.1